MSKWNYAAELVCPSTVSSGKFSESVSGYIEDAKDKKECLAKFHEDEARPIIDRLRKPEYQSGCTFKKVECTPQADGRHRRVLK